MALELEGTLFKKFDIQKVKDSFQKREFVIETSENYPQKIKLELTQDKCGLLDSYNEGDKIKVQFNVRGSEWQGKFFVNLQAWRIEAADGASNAGGSTSGSGSSKGNFPPPTEPIDNGYGDDLPF